MKCVKNLQALMLNTVSSAILNDANQISKSGLAFPSRKSIQSAVFAHRVRKGALIVNFIF